MAKALEKEKQQKTETKKEKNKNIHEIVIKMDGERWEKAMDDSFKKHQKDAKVDGFRKGKVPRNIYEKHFGKESLFIDAADSLLQEAYEKAIDESKLIPVVQPGVDLKSLDENGVEFLFKIITKPEVKVKKYKGLSINPEKVKVTKEEIDHELSHVLERYTEIALKEGKVENGDIAVIDFEGFKDGVAFDGGKGENYSLEIGSNTFIPGLEEKEIKVTFPDDYNAEDLKGCDATFKVKVNEVKEKIKREMDEDFFLDLGMEGVNSEESLRKEIESNIKAQKEADAENKYIDKILEEVSKNVDVDIPQEMVDEETERLLKRFEQQMQMQGISLDVYYQFTQTTEENLKEQLEKEAYQNVLYRLMLEEITSLEKIEVTAEEAEEEALNLAKKYQMEKEQLLEQFGGIDMIQYDLEMRKTIETLKELNK